MIEDEAKLSPLEAKIQLGPYFNLFPEIKLYIDMTTTVEEGTDEQGQKTYTKIYNEVYDVSDCATNIRIKSVLYNSCGQLTCKLIHESCQQFQPGDRVRLYLDGRCWFCGFIFTREIEDKTSVMITAFDYLRYFKAPLTYGKSQVLDTSGHGLSASALFTKVCQDLKIPFEVIEASTIPCVPMNYTQQTGFKILETAMTETLVNSSKDKREYYMYYHESHFPEDESTKEKEVKMEDQTVYKTSGRVVWRLRGNLITDALITNDMVYKYNYKESIDDQTFNEIIVYKDQKSYTGKDGKTVKNGKKTGTQIRKTSQNNELKARYGYLPYYHKAPDGWSEAQMQQIADELNVLFSRPTQSLSLECYGITGMRAGYLVPVMLEDIGGSDIGVKEWDKDKKDYVYHPAYRTVKSCEMFIQWPLKMSLQISSGKYSEYE